MHKILKDFLNHARVSDACKVQGFCFGISQKDASCVHMGRCASLKYPGFSCVQPRPGS